MSQIDVLLGRGIAEERSKRGVSHGDLARSLGLSVHTIAAFENGSRRATALQLFQIAEALDVQVEGLFGRVRDEPFSGPAPAAARPLPAQVDEMVGHYSTLSKSHRSAAFAFLVALKRGHRENSD